MAQSFPVFQTQPFDPKIIEINRAMSLMSAGRQQRACPLLRVRCFDFRALITILIGDIRDNTI